MFVPELLLITSMIEFTIILDAVCVYAKTKNSNHQCHAGKVGATKKKSQCDRCGFRARFTSQLLVYHVDGDLNNTALRNLRTVCRNCVEEIARTEITWRAGDLEPDA